MLSYKDMWAKTEPYESLESHMKRSGLYCKVGLLHTSLRSVWDVLRSNIVNVSDENLLNFICYLCSMHDIGKAFPCFQAMYEPMADLLTSENLLGLSNYDNFRHECQSQYYMLDLLESKRNFSEESADVYSRILGMHHERKSYVGKGDARGRCYDLPQRQCVRSFWKSVVNDLETSIYNLFPFSTFDISCITNLDVFCHFLDGLFIICDWLASEPYYINKYSVSDLLYSDEIILSIMKEKGFINNSVSFKSVGYNTLLNSNSMTLRPIQKWTVDYFGAGNSYDFMIIESGTGSGKSSVGLYSCLHSMNDTDGFYFALPMKSMVNSKYNELKYIFEKNRGMHITLLHGTRDLVDDYNPSYTYTESETGESYEVNSYLSGSSRRGLLNKYIVGTIDQLLNAILPNRYSILRLVGLAGKTIILDEIHTYDSYTGALIIRLLSWCKALNIKVIMMSATLTRRMKEEYLKAYSGKDITLCSSGYPLVTVYDRGTVCEHVIEGGDISKEIVVKRDKNRILCDINSQAKEIKAVYDSGTNVVVFKNTVASAQELYKLLRRQGVENILLCHSRFNIKDRLEKESLVIDLFGKNSVNRPLKYIVITTQVMEASIDVDFDMGFSDLAPIDILYQRMGRVSRFGESIKGNNRNKFFVFMPEHSLGVSEYVYPDIFLHNTKNYIDSFMGDNSQFIVKLPEQLRNSIEKVYSNVDVLSESLLEKFVKYSSDAQLKKNMGISAAIREPNAKLFTKRLSNSTLFDEDDIVNVSTRLFAPSYNVLFISKSIANLYNFEDLSFDDYKHLMRYTFSVPVHNIKSLNNPCISLIPEGRLAGFLLFKSDSDVIHDTLCDYSYSYSIGFEITSCVK